MRIIGILVATLILSGCATAYQPSGFTGGYSSTRLDANVFQVDFRGNGFTGRIQANDFALLRSAELALENGYQYFIIIDAQQYSKHHTYTTPTTSQTTINANTQGTVTGYGNTANYSSNTYGTAITTTHGGHTYDIVKPTRVNTIICFKNKPEGFSYNASFIEKSIKEKYQLNHLR